MTVRHRATTRHWRRSDEYQDGNGAQGRNYPAAIGTDGLLDAWNPTAIGFVNVLTVSGSTLYAGGSFHAIDGDSRSYFSARCHDAYRRGFRS